ncbi:MAG: hypothetical protein AAF696_07630 [Bacteroidota bacterium]
MSKVSITQAAKLVGVTRSTMHKHIDKKGITVDRDEEGKNPKIDVSELIRVYGNTLKSPDEVAQEAAKKGHPLQDNTPSNTVIQTEILKERLSILERERDRERNQLLLQIDNLKESLSEAQEQQKKITLLLTDQREVQGRGLTHQTQRIKQLEKHIQDLRKRNRAIVQKLEKKKWWKIL